MEYDFLVNNPSAKLADVKVVIEEMSALKTKLRTERQSMMKEMKSKGYSKPNNGGDCDMINHKGGDNYGHNGGMRGHKGGDNYGHNGGMMNHNR